MDSWHSYPSLYNLGHRALKDLFSDPVLVEEKIDINCGEEHYLSYEEKSAEAQRIGLEIVPIIHSGIVDDVNIFRSFLDRESCLGGQKVEGVVIKNYSKFGPDKKALMGKFVSEHFKEVHKGEWKVSNPGSSDVIQLLVTEYKTPARWQKAVQHLKEAGKLENSPKDIGLLMREVPSDIEKECVEEIKDKLYAWAMPKIKRASVAGLAEWYKEQLLCSQFENIEPKGSK